MIMYSAIRPARTGKPRETMTLSTAMEKAREDAGATPQATSTAVAVPTQIRPMQLTPKRPVLNTAKVLDHVRLLGQVG